MQLDPIPEAWLSCFLPLPVVMRYAPGVMAPAEQRQRWQDFLDEYEPTDQLWAYHTGYDDKLAALTNPGANGWAGFALVRAGEIVAHYKL